MKHKPAVCLSTSFIQLTECNSTLHLYLVGFFHDTHALVFNFVLSYFDVKTQYDLNMQELLMQQGRKKGIVASQHFKVLDV